MTDWDEPFTIECGKNEALYYTASKHDNNREDRRFDFKCRDIGHDASLKDCSWSGYVNKFDEPFAYMCRKNAVMTGVESYHDNDKEDRRWNFQCCQPSKGYLRDCLVTEYLNDWDGTLFYHSASGFFFTGMFSYHDNKKQ